MYPRKHHVSHYSNITVDYRDLLRLGFDFHLCLALPLYPCSTFIIPLADNFGRVLAKIS